MIDHRPSARLCGKKGFKFNILIVRHIEGTRQRARLQLHLLDVQGALRVGHHQLLHSHVGLYHRFDDLRQV